MGGSHSRRRRNSTAATARPDAIVEDAEDDHPALVRVSQSTVVRTKSLRSLDEKELVLKAFETPRTVMKHTRRGAGVPHIRWMKVKRWQGDVAYGCCERRCALTLVLVVRDIGVDRSCRRRVVSSMVHLPNK